ncbi:serine/threonine protein phosphatase [Serratia phage Slocum]|nr:serine/threonine protein phosphatase [Serratia phage Slocum]
MIWPTLHKTITVPDDARAFFVGDIHGGLDELNQALHEVGFNKEKDYLFAVGDLIDRGPKNLQVLALFLYDKTGRYHSVMGNHDAFLANVATPEYLWYMNGGKWAADLTDDAREDIARDMCKRMPVFMNVKHRGRDFGLVHGGIPPQFEDRGVNIRQRDWYEVINGILNTPFPNALDKWYAMEPFMWDRDCIAWAKANIKGKAVAEFPDVLGVDFTVHGHTPQREPLRYGNRIWLDTEGRKGTFSIMENDDCLTTVLMTPHGSGEEPKYIKLF